MSATPALTRHATGFARGFLLATAVAWHERCAFLTAWLTLARWGTAATGYGLHATEAMVVLGALVVPALCLPALTGGIADRIGLKPAIRRALLFELAGLACLGLAATFWWVLAGAALMGLGVGLARPALHALIARCTTADNGPVGWSLAFGGFAVAALVATLHVIAPPGLSPGLGVGLILVALVLLWRVREPGPPGGEAPAQVAPAGREGAWRALAAPSLVPLLVGAGLAHVAILQTHEHLPAYTVAWGITNAASPEHARVVDHIGQRLGLVRQFATALLALPLALLTCQLRPLAALQLGAGLTGVGIALAVATQAYAAAVSGVVVVALGELLVMPRLLAHLAQLAPANRLASRLGLADLPQGLAWLVVWGLGGPLYTHLADRTSLARGWLQQAGGTPPTAPAGLTDEGVLALLARAMHATVNGATDQLWRATHPQLAWVPVIVVALAAGWVWRSGARQGSPQAEGEP